MIPVQPWAPKFLHDRFTRWHCIVAVAFLAAALASACTTSPGTKAVDRLHPCKTDEAPRDAYCGSLRVYENREVRAGRQIDLAIVVLPAIGNSPKPDPLFFLAGGPGQAAAQMASELAAVLQPVERDRDIVLVDQRGTGKSHPLNCRSNDETLRAISESDEESLARLRHCLDGYDADVRQYTTPIAMDDLDDVRAYLGYDRINLYGVSYGTRAALVYLRRHGSHVRTITLDGVAPMDMHLPMFAARDAQRALDRLLHDCEADVACRASYPGLSQRIRALVARVAAAPLHVRLQHPRTGVVEDVVINDRFVPSVLFSALYSPLTASIVPALVARAEQNDFQGLAALAFAGEQGSVSVGMQMSILCSEDARRIDPPDVAREADGTVFGMSLAEGQLRACSFWPKGEIDASYYQPVVSDVPALVLSGGADPVTPPRWGEEVASHLKNARHIVVPASGHGVISTTCGGPLVAEFISKGSARDLEIGCVERLRRPPFFVTPAGPEPTPPEPAAPAAPAPAAARKVAE